MERNFVLKIVLNVILITLVGMMTSCSDEDTEKKERLKIESISPAIGLPGMQVTLTGTEFSVIASENAVTFNGTPATIISSTETELVVEVPENGSTGTIDVGVNNKKATGPSFRYIDVYLLGTRNYKITLWKNDEFVSEISGNVLADALFIQGADVYISGNTFTDGYVDYSPVYWKNGTLVPFAGRGVATDIFVQRADVYASGIVEYGMTSHAVYWRNGIVHDLTDSAAFPSEARTVEMVGTDLYVGGIVFPDDQLNAAYWKNDVITEIPHPAHNIELQDMKIADGIVHVAGTDRESFPNQMVYWKTNGEWTSFANATHFTEVTSLDVSGTSVFISGIEKQSDIDQGVVWTTGNAIRYTDGLINGNAVKVIAIGKDIVVTGVKKVGGYNTIYIAINDQVFTIPTETNLSVNDMVVK